MDKQSITAFFEKVYDKILGLVNVFDFEILIYYFSIVPAALILEILIVGWNKSSTKRLVGLSNTVKTDVIFFFLEAFNLYSLITVILSFGIFHVLARLIFEYTNYDLILHIDNYALQFAVLFVISDFKNYVSHFVFHKIPALWKLHEFHHSATDFCMLTRYRGHFIEVALKRFFDVIPFAIFGASIETYVAVKVLSEIHQLVIHSSLKSDWGWIGKYILVSPAAHRVHHSRKEIHFDKNFATTFIFWDRLFGTYSSNEVEPELGIPGDEYNQKGFVHDTILGIRNFFKYLKPSRVKE